MVVSVQPKRVNMAIYLESQIPAIINHIETTYNIKILYLCETGSRLWGYANDDSDYDLRFIYTHSLDHYLSLNIEHRPDTITVSSKMFPNIDVSGWDIRKFLKLAEKTNVNCYEWLYSDKVHCIYKQSYIDLLKSLVIQFYNPVPVIAHYYGSVKADYLKSVRKGPLTVKQGLYITRNILNLLYVYKYSSFPPLDFNKLLNATSDQLNSITLASIQMLLFQKKASINSFTKEHANNLSDFISEILHKKAKLTNSKTKKTELCEGMAYYIKGYEFSSYKYSPVSKVNSIDPNHVFRIIVNDN